MSIKGSWRRPSQITRAEKELREEYAEGKISRQKFDRAFAKLKKLGLIQRSGRVLK